MSGLAVVPGVVAALCCGLLGLLVPRLIGRIPEPERPGSVEAERDVPALDEEQAKEPYAAIAALPGLRIGAVLTGALAGGALGLWLGWSWPLLVWAALVPIGTALAVVDWRTRLLPTKVLAPTYGLVIALLLLGWPVTGSADDLLRAGLGWLAAGGTFFLLWFVYPKGLGYGDVRLSGILGLALGQLGWAELVIGLYAGFLFGAVIGTLVAWLRKLDGRSYPFGPFMLVGALFGVLLGPATAGLLWG